MSKTNKKFIEIFGLSIALVANAFLFIPVTLYLGNIESFAAPLWSVLYYYSMPALICVLSIILLNGFISEKFYNLFVSLIASAIILIWFQGNILIWEYGLLDGENINWGYKKWRGWVDLCVWLGVVLLLVKYRNRFKELIIQFVFAVFVLQLFIQAYAIFSNINELYDKAETTNLSNALDNVNSFSSKNNVLHIILDGFQADVFNEIINNEVDGEYYRKELEGFSFFREHMGVFPTTYMTMPVVLGAQVYKNHMPKKDFIDEVYKGNTILNLAYKKGYEVDIVSEVNMLGMYAKGKHTNAFIVSNDFYEDPVIHVMDDTVKLFDLTLFRIAPHFLKKYIYNEQRWFLRSIVLDQEYQQFRYFSHTAFINNVAKNISVERNRPVYKFFHLMNTHWPMVVNDDCKYAGGSLPRNRATVTAQSKCGLDAVINLLNKMKKLGIYKDSLIVLMGDHGAYLPPYRFNSQFIADKDTAFKIEPWLVAQVTPLMLIKTPNSSTDPINVSDVPSSILDTPATINSILKLGGNFRGQSILELESFSQRERKHYFYEWTRKDWSSDYSGPIQEILINGSVYDANAWRLGQIYTPQTK